RVQDHRSRVEMISIMIMDDYLPSQLSDCSIENYNKRTIVWVRIPNPFYSLYLSTFSKRAFGKRNTSDCFSMLSPLKNDINLISIMIYYVYNNTKGGESHDS